MTKEELFKQDLSKFKLKCGVCGKEFIPESYKQYYNLTQKAKKYNRKFYCSNECKRKDKGSIKYHCDNCNKLTWVKNYDITRTDKHFCCRECCIQYNVKNKKREYVWKCKTCNESFLTRRALQKHYLTHPEHRTNRIKLKKLYVCPYCGLEKITTKEGMSFHSNRCIKNKNRIISHSHTLSDDSKKKISLSMKKAHKEGRAWNIGKSRWNNEQSYPEKFFELVINNEFKDKNYKKEYSLGIYSLDFAWIHKKKCIEIDGDQHQRYENYKQRDKRKDACIKENGWEVLRIAWKDMFHDTKKWIKIAKEFIDI